MTTIQRLLSRSCLLASLLAVVPVGSAAPAWHVVHGEFFDLYTNSGKSAAVDAAVWVEQFRRTVGSLWKIEARDVRRATIVQFRSEKEFSQYRSAQYIAGYFSRTEANPVMVYHDESGDGSVRLLVQHEAVHWLLNSKRSHLPAWLNEGLAELYSTFSITGSTCRLFQADDQNLRWLQRSGIPSLEIAVMQDRPDVDYNDREKVRDFYAQAWALTHYLICSTDVKGGGARIANYLELLERGVSRREAFEPAFGVSFEQMQRDLGNYIRGGSYRVLKTTFSRDELRASFTAIPASELEVGCVLARVKLTGKRDIDGAETSLRRAREAAPDSPLPYEGLGCVALARGDRRTAAGYFAQAAERGSTHPYAYFLPASDELSDRLANRPTRRDLRPQDARRLSDALRRALELDRNLERAADQFGRALLFTEPVRTDDVQFLADLAPVANDPAVVRYRVAGLLHRLGDPRARTILQNLADTAEYEDLKQAAEADLATVDGGDSKVLVGGRRVIKPRATAPGMSLPIERPGR